MEYMTTQQAAEKWDVSLRWVQTYLKNERIEGAVRFGRDWMIPKNAEKPIDGRLKKSKDTAEDVLDKKDGRRKDWGK